MIEVDEIDSDLLLHHWTIVKQRKTSYARRQPVRNHAVSLHQVVARRMGIVGMADHKDRNGLNCRRSNLRPATKSQNAANEGMRCTNSTGFRGVSPYKDRYQVKIREFGKKAHVGYFTDKIEAAKAYDARARVAFGEFASLNFP